MASSEESAAWGQPVAPLRGAAAEQAEAFVQLRQNVRAGQEKLREMAAAVAATESKVADTLQRLAESALSQGRHDVARRLAAKAAEARRVADREHQQIDHLSATTSRAVFRWEVAEDEWAAAGHARDVAVRQREEAARQRDEAARRRDAAAHQRDELALERDKRAEERDLRAQERALRAGRRDADAVERESEKRWSPRGTFLEAPPEARAEQSAIEEEIQATHRGLAKDDRRQSAADRDLDAADRAEAGQDRRAAAQDRRAAQADRAAAARDRAAAQVEREQPWSRRDTDE